MIVHFTDGAPVEEYARRYDGIRLGNVVVTSSKHKEYAPEYSAFVVKKFVAQDDVQLASRAYEPRTRLLDLGMGVKIGGTENATLVVAGPCSVESAEQIEFSAQFCRNLGIKMLRAGAYKPRTSPYTFQGLGLEGLKLLARMREKYGLLIITEVRDATHVEEVIEYADVVQIGAKAMYDHGLLRRCGKSDKPVLLKRHFGATLQEFVQAAEFILSGGNPNVILCERGIRTFETKTRFTLDFSGAAYLKTHVNLPLFIDPSHGVGWRWGVADLTRAAVAFGVEGVLIETHPNPAVALSDAEQQLSPEDFASMYRTLEPIAAAVGRKII
jgi:3-deoxy-7-phosphoheptulonate synthase